MSSENEIKPGMLVLWTGGRADVAPLPMKDFLGFVIAELKVPDILPAATRKFLVFVRCSDTGQGKKIVPIYEHRIIPFSKEK